MSLLCKLGIHKWKKAVYTDHSIHSNVVDYRQDCARCQKRIKWVQPKGINKRFYPKYLMKNRNWVVWGIIILVLLIILIAI